MSKFRFELLKIVLRAAILAGLLMVVPTSAQVELPKMQTKVAALDGVGNYFTLTDHEAGAYVSDNCTSYFKGTLNAGACRDGEVPSQVAFWLFISAIVGFVLLSNKSDL